MIDENKELFERFGEVHHRYEMDEEGTQDEFNKIGKEVMFKVREYEARLCRTSENGGFNHFTGGLAEKFQNEVRKLYPSIDMVGVKVKKFELKRISL